MSPVRAELARLLYGGLRAALASAAVEARLGALRGEFTLEELSRHVGSAEVDSLSAVADQWVRMGFLEQPAPGVYRATALGGVTDRPEFRRLAAYLNQVLNPAGLRLGLGLQTGQTPFEIANSAGFLDVVAGDPDTAALWQDVLAFEARELIVPHVVERIPWSSIASVVDLGGGSCAMLEEVIRYHSHVRGTLVDLPGVLDGCVASPGIAIVPADVRRDPLPSADVYLAVRCLAMLDDNDVERAFSNIASHMSPQSRLDIFEPIKDEDGGQSFAGVASVMLLGRGLRTRLRLEQLMLRSGLVVKSFTGLGALCHIHCVMRG